jgi:uncharacterized membrane protein
MRRKNRKAKNTELANAVEIKCRAEIKSEELLDTVSGTVSEMQNDFFPSLIHDKNRDEIKETVEATGESLRRTRKNLVKAYETLFEVSDELSGRWHDVRGRLLPSLANARIDEEEVRKNHFSRGINIYKILWIFYIGSFGGVILEMIWCWLQKGHIESRQGLVYGPFNVLYGLGAVALSYFLYRYRNHTERVSFAGGFIVGSVLEYICSWGQEFTLGVRAWDYSHLPFNINGRICLYYSLMWGVLGVIWIKKMYPLLSKLILAIPDKVGKVLTWLLLVFFIFNIIASGFIMARWTTRTQGKAASSAVESYIDEYYPDERMQKLFPNWVFQENSST